MVSIAWRGRCDLKAYWHFTKVVARITLDWDLTLCLSLYFWNSSKNGVKMYVFVSVSI